MKLLFCEECHDIRALKYRRKITCSCGKSSGRYVNSTWAEYQGPCQILGLRNQEVAGCMPGQHLDLYVIPDGAHILRGRIRIGEEDQLEKMFRLGMIGRVDDGENSDRGEGSRNFTQP